MKKIKATLRDSLEVNWEITNGYARRIGVIAVLSLIIYGFYSPVLLCISEGPMPADKQILILSPFRDRTPEKLAEQLLTQIARGDCHSALVSAGQSKAQAQGTCQREREDPLETWALRGRWDTNGKCTLQYVWHGKRAGDGSFLEIETNRGDGAWTILSYVRMH